MGDVGERGDLARLTRKGGLLALVLAPVALAAVLISEPKESPADSLFAVPTLPMPSVAAAKPALPATLPPPAVPDVDLAIPTGSYLVSQQLTSNVVAAEAGAAAESVVIEVASGDTLMALLTREGVSRGDAHEAVTALEEVFSARNLRPGQQLRLTFEEPDAFLAEGDEDSPELHLVALALQPSAEEDIQVFRDGDGNFTAAAQERPLRMEMHAHSGVIEGSLYAAAQKEGVSAATLIELIRIFSFDVDFQREIQPGDSFEVLYEAYYDDAGELAKTGRILFAGLTLSGKPIELYNFTPSSGFEDFFDITGQSVRKALMKTPIDGARISSGFGMRKHPILGYSKMHKGVDFAAPTGTPIYAAGDGFVEVAGWNGGYGKYVRIKHNGSYKTAYAHMSKIAKGIGKGIRVMQGEIIGYVGTTGRSTGPHLHYEILVDNKQVNPLGLKLPAGEKLEGTDLANFLAAAAEINKLRKKDVGTQIAESP